MPKHTFNISHSRALKPRLNKCVILKQVMTSYMILEQDMSSLRLRQK
ncbi:hypothetical protein SeseC_01735 [Streptococcus equi subsp. zooepidemicus ATCC 35246]|nr:hypothetical protein SeseC_01735 [Streptococcus equi subsp. zooepidemicus ATCC 35246]